MSKLEQNNKFAVLAGLLSMVAGVLALASLVVGLMGVDYDFEVFSDASSLAAAGSNAAGYIRLSYWMNMLGNYGLLIPLALYLLSHLDGDSLFLRWFTLTGLLYFILGAAGSAILAEAWPFLMVAYESADTTTQTALAYDFGLVTAIAEGGLHGILQNLCGALWFIGIGWVLKRIYPGPGVFMTVVGLFLVLNSIGNAFSIEILSLTGLTGSIVLGPIWSIWIGAVLLTSSKKQ